MPYLIGAIGVLALLVAVITDRVGAAGAGGADVPPTDRPGSTSAEGAGSIPAGQPGATPADRPGTVPADRPRPAPAERPASMPTVEPGAAPTAPPGPRPEQPVAAHEPSQPPSLVPSAHGVPVPASAEHSAAPGWPAAAADLLRGLGRLPGVRGWAIVGAEGAVVAADPAMRTALIAGGDELARAAAAVADRLGFVEWRSVELRGPTGSIQAMSGPGGWSLLALLGPEADGGRVIAEGRRILGSLAGE